MTSPAKLLLVLALATGGSCRDVSAPPAARPGTLLLNLTTPYTDDAALVLHLTGPSLAPASIAPAASMQHLSARSAASGVNVAVFGPIGAGALLRVRVPDVNRATEYRVTVIEAADGNNALRASVSGYSGQFVKD